MTHPLVDQLRFARSEFTRGLAGISEEHARQRVGEMNCISWMVGHLAWQEQRYWLQAGQRQIPFPALNEMHAYGKPPCTPPMGEIWATWQAVTAAADPWLDALTQERLAAPIKPDGPTVGSLLLRTTYHYWYHLGEAMALRQILEKGPTPDFVGDIDTEAPYRPEPAM